MSEKAQVTSHPQRTPRVVETACFEAGCAALKAARELSEHLAALEREGVEGALIQQEIVAGDLLDPALVVLLRDLMRVLAREVHAECFERDAMYDHDDGRRDRTPVMHCSARGQRLKVAQMQLADIYDALASFEEHICAARTVERLLH